jgi:hypothetical protein
VRWRPPARGVIADRVLGTWKAVVGGRRCDGGELERGEYHRDETRWLASMHAYAMVPKESRQSITPTLQFITTDKTSARPPLQSPNN